MGLEFLIVYFLATTPQIVVPQNTPYELKCPKPIIYDMTDLPWEDIDDETFNISKKRCAQLFLNSPCLIKFIKKKERGYNAICGAKR